MLLWYWCCDFRCWQLTAEWKYGGNLWFRVSLSLKCVKSAGCFGDVWVSIFRRAGRSAPRWRLVTTWSLKHYFINELSSEFYLSTTTAVAHRRDESLWSQAFWRKDGEIGNSVVRRWITRASAWTSSRIRAWWIAGGNARSRASIWPICSGCSIFCNHFVFTK